ncbi:hypothetical protein SCP_0605970 [Sparassis crispa]|uniref:Protein kinase domain-containing protein n=1 Tax=Sparassis crispa TaxID=139825 RepID=A0A401GQV8_9APHY|nr:hypothetical protein SCP_0605970 [Sparassis crispa]GBE84618.1 hypothetical protein SCP_0605970 [Sparassis crispa]
MVATPLAKNDPDYEVWQKPEDFDHSDVKGRYRRFASSARRFILGPMPLDEFLEFLPETDMSNMPRPINAFNEVPAEARTEQQIYKPLIAAINGTRSRKSQRRCPGFTFKDTATSGAELGEIGSMNAHVCCYSQDLNDSHSDPLGGADLYIDVQRYPSLDPFTDPTPENDRRSHEFVINVGDDRTRKHAEEALGRNVACATEVCARQHRAFYFSISLAGSRARLIRWDRCGAIVSESFDIRAQPGPLCEFLWRYAHASKSQRGYDVSVEPATREEEELFRESIKRHVKLQLDLDEEDLVAAMEEHYQPGVVVAVNMVDEGSPGQVARRLLISRPVVSPVSLTGRGTRGYWAVTADGPRSEVVFLKDTWRYNGQQQKEGAILADLQGAGVSNIPRLISHGDVLERLPIANRMDEDAEDGDVEELSLQRTLTDRFQQAHWVCKLEQIPQPPLVHYRLVLGTVGYGLQRFEGTQELLQGTFDAYQAILGAFNLEDVTKRRLHRDVSIGNIILFRDPKGTNTKRYGYLIDWGLSCLVTEEGEACDHTKAGTLQFMSQRILSHKKVAHTIQDDMESILWVVLYCSLRWLDHNLPLGDLAKTMVNIFDRCTVHDDGYVMASDAKLRIQFDRGYTSDIYFRNPTIQLWLDEVMKFNSSNMFPHVWGAAFAEVWKDPAMFNAFWRDFLRVHEISDHDRVWRELIRPDDHPYKPPSSSSSTSQVTHPAPAALPSRKRKAVEEPVGADAEKMTSSRVPAVPREGYRGPITRSMAKRRQIEGQGQGAVAGGSDLPIQDLWSPRRLRPRPKKIDKTSLARQGPKVRRSKK